MTSVRTPLIVALTFSLALHALFAAIVSGTGVFDFIPDFTNKPLTARLISGIESRPPKLSGTRRRTSSVESAPKISKAEPQAPSIEPVPAENKSSEESTTTPPAPITGFPGNYVQASGSENFSGSPLSEGQKIKDMIVNPEPRSPILKSAREKLSYNIYWFGIYVGRADLEAVRSEDEVTIKSVVHSAPVISAVYTVDDYSECRVINGLPADFRIKQHEGKYRSDKETVFDLDNGHITFKDYLKGTKNEYAVGSSELWDLISGFYYLRTQPFEVGKTIDIDVFDSKKFFIAEVNVIGKERIRLSENEEVDTVKVKPRLKSEGLFQNKGDILIWLTDDDSKTPVKIETKVPIGTVIAVLASVEVNN